MLIAGGGGGLAFSPSPALIGVHGTVDGPGPGLSGNQGLTNDVSGNFLHFFQHFDMKREVGFYVSLIDVNYKTNCNS